VVALPGFVAGRLNRLSLVVPAGLECVAQRTQQQNRRSARLGCGSSAKRLANTGRKAAVEGGQEAEPVRESRFNHAAVGHQGDCRSACRRPWVVVESDSKD